MKNEKVGALLSDEGYEVGNIDSILIAQQPKLMPYLSAMRRNIAGALRLSPGQVSVKATTEEHLGFTGRGEGIAAQAVCLLHSRRDLPPASHVDKCPPGE